MIHRIKAMNSEPVRFLFLTVVKPESWWWWLGKKRTKRSPARKQVKVEPSPNLPTANRRKKKLSLLPTMPLDILFEVCLNRCRCIVILDLFHQSTIDFWQPPSKRYPQCLSCIQNFPPDTHDPQSNYCLEDSMRPYRCTRVSKLDESTGLGSITLRTQLSSKTCSSIWASLPTHLFPRSLAERAISRMWIFFCLRGFAWRAKGLSEFPWKR